MWPIAIDLWLHSDLQHQDRWSLVQGVGNHSSVLIREAIKPHTRIDGKRFGLSSRIPLFKTHVRFSERRADTAPVKASIGR